MKIGTTEITKDNFNELLQREINVLNSIRDAKVMRINEGDVVGFHELNISMSQNAEKYRRLSFPLGRIGKLERQAELWYNSSKIKARLDLVELKNKYTSDELRRGYVEGEAQEDYERWVSTKALRECVEIERHSVYDYSNRLEKISRNLQAEIYANR